MKDCRQTGRLSPHDQVVEKRHERRQDKATFGKKAEFM
jgi:hypothetical protein